MDFYSKEIYEEYKKIISKYTVRGLFKGAKLYLKILLILTISMYALTVIALLYKPLTDYLVEILAIFVIVFLITACVISKQSNSNTKEDDIKELDTKVAEMGYDDEMIQQIIKKNVELDSEFKEEKNKKFDWFFKLFTTFYLSLFLFFSKEIWDLFKNNLQKNLERNSYVMATIAFLLIVVGVCIIYYALTLFFVEPKLSKIKYFNNALYEVLVYRKKKDIMYIKVSFNTTLPPAK
ncbi:hypothetical protein ACWN8V_07790 [Vagococcus elongatus]|uniref:Uncharacterized protein n=1 Tax=Vagococcus elongatus TaxID=180344 RepID=A0A430AU07_9ENTE|nr:hypothetical protein [Vagococcus elongatus]RSU11542.1 hypothetical protein CBF29_07620 [Vagococcus elongatus]